MRLDRGAVCISNRDIRNRNLYVPKKGYIAEGTERIRRMFLGRMQKMLRTVTSVERYHNRKILNGRERSCHERARAALFMVFLYGKRGFPCRKVYMGDLSEKKGF